VVTLFQLVDLYGVPRWFVALGDVVLLSFALLLLLIVVAVAALLLLLLVVGDVVDALVVICCALTRLRYVDCGWLDSVVTFVSLLYPTVGLLYVDG